MEETMVHNMAAVPGVTSVGIANSVPMDDNHWMDPVFAQDTATPPGSYLRCGVFDLFLQDSSTRWGFR